MVNVRLRYCQMKRVNTIPVTDSLEDIGNLKNYPVSLQPYRNIKSCVLRLDDENMWKNKGEVGMRKLNGDLISAPVQLQLP